MGKKQKQDDRPPEQTGAGRIISWSILFILVSVYTTGIGGIDNSRIVSSAPSGAYINNNSVISPRVPYIPRIDILGGRVGDIIYCESSGNPRAVNKKSNARGLLQIVPSSREFCEKGLGRKIDLFNPDDNLLCGEYLYQYGGLSHWRSSAHCWR